MEVRKQTTLICAALETTKANYELTKLEVAQEKEKIKALEAETEKLKELKADEEGRWEQKKKEFLKSAEVYDIIEVRTGFMFSYAYKGAVK